MRAVKEAFHRDIDLLCTLTDIEYNLLMNNWLNTIDN